jgi:hypothetical protein
MFVHHLLSSMPVNVRPLCVSSCPAPFCHSWLSFSVSSKFCICTQMQESRFEELARLLRDRVPQLWTTPQLQLMTECGRSLLAKAGFVASRVEFTKSSGGRHIAVTHIGAGEASWMSSIYFLASAGCMRGFSRSSAAECMGFLLALCCDKLVSSYRA